jgi:hypothetical protein
MLIDNSEYAAWSKVEQGAMTVLLADCREKKTDEQRKGEGEGPGGTKPRKQGRGNVRTSKLNFESLIHSQMSAKFSFVHSVPHV